MSLVLLSIVECYCVLQFSEYVICTSAGCIAIDESNERLFLSDSNHHRIIVSSGSGEILESVCIRFLLINPCRNESGLFVIKFEIL